jgi:Uma2 family endonuclease
MSAQHTLVTVEAFEQFLAKHPNGLYELVHGEIVAKVPTQEHAKIAGILIGELYIYLKQHPEIKAHVEPEVRYRPQDDVHNDRIPDVSVHCTELPPVQRGAVLGMPDIAVEIKSPDETYVSMREKAHFYLENGCKMVWLVYPEKRIVEVYEAEKDLDLLVSGDILSGGAVLPGLALALDALFTSQYTRQ